MSFPAAVLYQYALAAGFPQDTAVKMVAIALKESGGNPLAHNTTPPDDSYGLWQINMYGNLAAPRMAQFGLSSPSDLFDPSTNAAAAFQTWGFNDNNLQIAWAINDGGVNQSRYQSFLPVAMQAAQSFQQADGITGGGGPTATGSPPGLPFSLGPVNSAGFQTFIDSSGVATWWGSLSPLAKLGLGLLGGYALLDAIS
jgi:hypothetical protein